MVDTALMVAVVSAVSAGVGAGIRGYLDRDKSRMDGDAKLRAELLTENRQLRVDIDHVSDSLVKERETRSKQEAECVKRIAALEARLARLEGVTPPSGTPAVKPEKAGGGG